MTSPRLLDISTVKIRLLDRFGSVANQPQIRSASVGPANCAADIRCSPYASFDRLFRVSEGEKLILIQPLLPQSSVELSMKALSVGLPGRLNSSFTP